MRTLEFIVTGQVLRKSPDCDFSNIVAGSIWYLKAVFIFSDDWDECTKVASFWNDDDGHAVELDEENACVIPAAVLTDDCFSVSITGTKPDYKIISTETKVRQEENTAAEACDDTLIVDLDTRVIRIPKTVTNIGVLSDDEVCRLHFKIPQYYEGIDLSKFVIRINYLNAKHEGDVYDVMSSEVTEGMITFDWLVGRNAVAYNGEVHFTICLKEVEGDGEVVREFNTTIATLPVLPGLETGDAVVQEHQDLLEQWKNALFNGGGGSSSYGVGHGLKLVGNDLTVNSVSDFKGDNTLPASATLVQNTVGNIELLLETI